MKNKHTHFGYELPYTSQQEVTNEADPEDKWSSDSTHTDYTVSSVLRKVDGYADIASPFELELNTEYFLVYLIYSRGNSSRGDSFSHHSGSNIEFIEVFKDRSKAEALEAMIEKNHSNYNSKKDFGEGSHQITYKDECGNDKLLYCPWNGYFENLDSVQVLSVTLES